MMIELKNICYAYPGAHKGAGQLQGINLSIGQGECILLSGVSGCGKTTLTRVLNGLCPQFYEGVLTGEYRIGERDARRIPIHELGTIVGSVFQDPRSQFFATNATDELVLGMENIPLAREEMHRRTAATISLLEIERLMGRRIFPLSSGEKQRLAIASVCAMEPKVLVLDEPSANLDSEAIQHLSILLYRLKEKGCTIVLSEHRFSYVRELFDRLVFMENGKISSILSRDEALSLTPEQLSKMGIRGFQEPKLKICGTALEQGDEVLRVQGISCFRSGSQILDDVSFHVQRGQILAVAGQNGAGKSTLCRAVTGLYRSQGAVENEGRFLRRKQRTKASFFVQQDADYQLYAPTVEEGFYIGYKSDPQRREKTQKALAAVGLWEYRERHPISLSGGQKQRLLLALASVSGRRILVFDEPTSGLDGHNMRLTAGILKELASKGNYVVLITHDMELIDLVADSILYLSGGKIVYHKKL